ncbi:MAG: cyclic nucleotide-binding domain-containing protein [bacterium]|nr:cyclic nucleotide-binding domain-containing protein [bacterium]
MSQPLQLLHRTFGLISTDSDLEELIKGHMDPEHLSSFTCTTLPDQSRSLEYISYELPDLLIIDLDKPIEGLDEVQKVLKEDPWLIGISVICIVKENQPLDFLDIARKFNLVALLEKNDFENIRRALRVIMNAHNIMMESRSMLQFKAEPRGRIQLSNDVEAAERTANQIATFLLETGRIDRNKYYNLNMGLSELLINAIEHGNCNISFSEKTELLERGTNMITHIRELQKNEDISKKFVTLDYELFDQKSNWVITDMGNGFDHKQYLDSNPKNLFLPHGRGIMMARNSSDELHYNQAGNQVTLVCYHVREEEFKIPLGFRGQEEVSCQVGEKVFSEGEESSYLYYIISGEFEVSVTGKSVGILNPSDMFMGEMSFLLNRRRSATVIATRPSRLLKISQKEFIKIIKQYPNYMLLLSRLLAQRLSRSNLKPSPFIN